MDRAQGVLVGQPFRFDLLEADLDSHYPDFGHDKSLTWGLVVGAMSSSWSSDTQIQGMDWTARFAPPKAVRIVQSVKGASRISWREVKQHCLFVAVQTKVQSLNQARDIGRPAVRAVLALIRREVPLILAEQVLWEGALAPAGRRIMMSSINVDIEPTREFRSEHLFKVGAKLTKVSALGLPRHVMRSLEWLALARAARVRAEVFVHLWLAILTLAGHGQRKHDDDMKRITSYTQSMITGPGVVSPLRVAELNERLRRAKKLRHELVHRADDTQITEELLAGLEEDAFTLVDFELRKVGMPISA